MFISVIIPALNEQGFIARAIGSAQAAGADEIIVCDGGSSDDTRSHASALGCKVLQSSPGRGQQMATAANQAKGQLFVFLHADTNLTKDCLTQIRQRLGSVSGVASDNSESSLLPLAWGCFEHSIAAKGSKYRWLERGNSWRARKRKMVYGDQVQWMTRVAYEQVGGFEAIPIMEDVRMSASLRKLADPVVLPGPVMISARHWENTGVVRATIRNWLLYTLYRCGVSEKRINRMYR